MKIQTDKVFSIILPTRGRREMLERCIHSFLSKAAHPEAVEIILVVDHDDETMYGFGKYLSEKKAANNIKIVSVVRSERFLQRDYFNFGAQCSTGKYIWVSNDDYEVQTQNWDIIVAEAIEEFCAKNGDRVAYVMVHDDTHGNDMATIFRDGCCCPILTREIVEALNGVAPPMLPFSAADIILFNIIKALPESRVIDLIDKVGVLHFCVHNGRRPRDEISMRLYTVGGYQFTASEMEDFVHKVRRIMNTKIIAGQSV